MSNCTRSLFSLATIICGTKRRQIFVVVGSFLSLILAVVHAYVIVQGDDYVGPLLILDHLFDIELVLALLALCTAVGLWLLARFRFTINQPLEGLLFSVAIGCGAVAASILVLGFLSALRPIMLAGLIVILIIIARNEIVKVFCLVSLESSEIRNKCNVVSLTAFWIIAMFMITQSLLPSRDWDSLVYHLRGPMQFLQAGKIYLPADNENVAYVQLVHMLYLPLLAAGSLVGPALLSSFFSLLLGLAVFALALRFFDAMTAAFSSVLLYASPMILLIAITPRVDITVAFYLLLGQFALLIAKTEWRYFYFSALLLGMAVAIKLSALLYVVVSAPLIVWLAYRKSTQIVRTGRDLGIYAILLLAAAAPWLMKNWILFDAPLFPYLTRPYVDKWLTNLNPAQIVASASDLTSWTVLSQIQAPFSFADVFTNPRNLAPEAEAVFYITSPLFLIIPILGWSFVRNFYVIWLIVPALGFYVSLITTIPITNLRYLTPVIGPFTLAAVNMLTGRLVSLIGSKRGLGILVVLTVLLLVPTVKAMILWTSDRAGLAYLTGSIDRENYLLTTTVPPDYSAYARTVAYVNQHLPRESLVLMLYEARGFYFKVRVIQDNTLTNWLVLENMLSSTSCLNKTGISHVLFNAGAVEYYLKRGVSSNKLKLEQFRQFAEKCLVIVANEPGYVLYRVRE